MSNIDEISQSKEIEKNLNLEQNNIEDYIFTDENNNKYNKVEENEQTNNYKNIINNQQSIEFSENQQEENIQKENNFKNHINNMNNINNFTEKEKENNNIMNNDIEEEFEKDQINYDQENLNEIKNENNDNINENNNDNNEDEELPLITLNFISVCQCCKKSFDDNTYLPYLLKCGHFFCIKCINEYFTDKNGIKCPSDGLIAKSISELTLLSNLIPKNNLNKNINTSSSTNINNNNTNITYNTNKNNNEQTDINIQNNSSNQNYCPIHKDQKLSHVICDNNELICVYCAFECFKKNPKCEIKELSAHLNSFTSNINDIISNNQNEVLNLHDSLKKIKNNKEIEEKAVNTFFECLHDYLNEKKNDYLEQINNIFGNNTKKLGDKLEEVTQNIDTGENIKSMIEKFLEKGNNQKDLKEGYNDILNKYLMLEQKNKNSRQKMELEEYKFIHIDEDKIVKNFQSFGEIKILNKKTKFNLNLNDDFNYNNKDKNIKKIIFNENNSVNLDLKEKEKFIDNNIFNYKKENISKNKEDKSIDISQDKNKPGLKSFHNKNNFNYIILDDLSITNNNNSYLNNDNNILKLDINNEIDNNYYINENNFDEKNKGFNNILNKKNYTNLNNNFKKITFNNGDQKNKKVIIHKNTKSFNNYIDLQNYNTSLNNYYLLSKINGNNSKKDKERNITVNNYEVHQTLKNSFNNNYNYGHNYNNSSYLNKLFELNNNNSNYYGYNTNKNNIRTNRRKFTFLNDFDTSYKNNKFNFK